MQRVIVGPSGTSAPPAQLTAESTSKAPGARTRRWRTGRTLADHRLVPIHDVLPHLVGLPLAIALGLLVAGCKSDTEKYCDEVKAQQQRLTDIAANPDPARIFAVLPSYEALAAKAPDDIKADWATVIDRYQQLQSALSDVDVTPEQYADNKWRQGLTEEQVNGVLRAAAGLADPATRAALNSVQQQARDVCQTPLSF